MDRAHDSGDASALKEARKLTTIGPGLLAEPSAAIAIAARLLSVWPQRNDLLPSAVLKLCERFPVLESRLA